MLFSDTFCVLTSTLEIFNGSRQYFHKYAWTCRSRVELLIQNYFNDNCLTSSEEASLPNQDGKRGNQLCVQNSDYQVNWAFVAPIWCAKDGLKN